MRTPSLQIVYQDSDYISFDNNLLQIMCHEKYYSSFWIHENLGAQGA